MIVLVLGARISSPCNRLCPLSYYTSKYGLGLSYSASNSSIGSGINSPSPVPTGAGAFRFNSNNQTNTYRSPMSSPPRTKRDVPPRLPSKKQRSQSLTPVQPQTQRILNSNEKYQSADGVIHGPEVPPHVKRLMQIEKCESVDGISRRSDENKEPNGQNIFEETSTSADGIISGNNSNPTKFTSHSLPRGQVSKNGMQLHSRTSSLSRDASNHSLSPCVENKTPENEHHPPPKPLKDRNKEEVGHVNRVASYHPR